MSAGAGDGTPPSRYRQRSESVEVAARAVLHGALERGASVFEPDVRAWTKEVARDLYVRIVERTDTGLGTFQEKLEAQLSGTSRATYLLAVELMYLHVLPLTNVTARAKVGRIETALSWMKPPATLPVELKQALNGQGAFSGGTGFNVQIWRQIGWLLSFVQHWWDQADDVRAAALVDPWKFRAVVASQSADQPGIRNSLLYLAFPDTFFPIVSQDNKRAIRDAFVSLIGRSSGQDSVSVDRDLFAIHQIHQAREGEVNYYREPYVSQWRKQAVKGTRVWLIRPRDGRGVVSEWLEQGFVSLDGAHSGEMQAGASREQVRLAVEDGFQHLDYVQRLSLTTEYYSFLGLMKIDDYVVTVVDESTHDGTIHVGVITGTASYVGENLPQLTRPVTWSSKSGMSYEGEWHTFGKHFSQQGAVVDVTTELSSVEEIANSLIRYGQSGAQGKAGIHVPDQLVLSPPSDRLVARVYGDRDWLQEIINLLQDRRQIVLYGPPGTGKTLIARELAHHITGVDAVRVVQFHPSYAYEDFFEGFRPSKNSAGSVGFELLPGPLRQIAAEAAADPQRPHVLIIDEINRANLAKVFGELYYLLEYRGEVVQLQYSPGESFTLPSNVYFIGTMNTADRSIALVDTALRRRFAFVELHPDNPPVRDLLPRWLNRQGKSDDERAALLSALNAEIGVEDRDFKIGPAYLMTPDADREGGLRRVWEYSILPLLEEHYYGRITRQEVRSRFGLDTIRRTIATRP